MATIPKHLQTHCANPKCGHVEFWHEFDLDYREGYCDGVDPLGNPCGCDEFRKPANMSLDPQNPNNRKDTTNMADNKKSTSEKNPLEYTLPNGRTYVPRALGGFEDDVQGLRELAKMGKHTLLLGEPGVGKTALFQAAFPDSENEIGHSKLTAWDMLWRPRPMPDGTIEFDPSPLTRAVMHGKPFYFDEIMRCSEDALTPLYSAMDGRGFIIGGNLDGTDLPVKEGFTVIAASNPLVRGAFLPDAIASRFHIIDVQVSEELLVKLGLHDRLMTAWRNLSSQEGGDVWRPSVREMLAAQEFIDAGNWAQAAYSLTGWRVPARDRATVAGVIGPLFGVRVGDLGGVIK